MRESLFFRFFQNRNNFRILTWKPVFVFNVNGKLKWCEIESLIFKKGIGAIPQKKFHLHY